MKQPYPRNTAISPQRISEWSTAGRFYRQPPDDIAIQEWLKRFSSADRDVAARILDCVQVVSEMQIHEGYRKALKKIPGWNIKSANRNGRWLFVGFGGSGESGQAMLRTFREANQLSSAIYNSLFCSAIELPSMGLSAEDHVVFVDDFSGSGRQIAQHWPTLQELIAAESSCHLILTAATQTAMSKIRSLMSLIPSVHITLKDDDNIFSSECTYFTKDEKLIIEKYGKKADRKNPKGFGDCGLLFILSHRTPNNTIPILHAYHKGWRGLFPRFLLQAE